MVKVNTPPETPPPAPRAGADLQTDSSGLGSIELPVWVADISTPGEGGSNELEVADGAPTGYAEGTQAKAPDAGMTRQPEVTIYGWLKNNAPEKMSAEMRHFDLGAQVLRMCNAASDFLARGAFEVGTAIDSVASSDRVGEASMAELWPDGKGVDEVMASLVNRAGERVQDISAGPGKKVT